MDHAVTTAVEVILQKSSLEVTHITAESVLTRNVSSFLPKTRVQFYRG